MGLIAIESPGATVRVSGGALQIECKGAILKTLQAHAISELQVHPSTEITAAARQILLSEGIDVVFIDGRGRLMGRLMASLSRTGERRLAWYTLVSDPQRRLTVARQIIAGKIANQRALYTRRQQRLKSEVIANAMASMRGLVADALAAPSLEVLRGVEGLAARLHFAAFGAALTSEEFTFTSRNRRPPRDPVNAALSFGYTRLIARCQGAAWRAGLDPYLGCLHDAGRGATALAFDLAEEFRPVVDAVVLELFNRHQLAPGDFRRPPPAELGETAELLEDAEEAVYMNRIGAEILIRALEKRFREPATHPLQDNQWPLGELVLEQARQLARIAEGHQDSYHPVRLGG